MSVKQISDIKNRQFALLTKEMYDQLKDKKRTDQLLQSADFGKLKDLDSSIEKLLRTPNLKAQEKTMLYANLLKQFMKTKDKAPETAKPEKKRVIIDAKKSKPSAVIEEVGAEMPGTSAEPETPKPMEQELFDPALFSTPLKNEEKSDLTPAAPDVAQEADETLGEREILEHQPTPAKASPPPAAAAASADYDDDYDASIETVEPPDTLDIITDPKRREKAEQMLEAIRNNPDKYTLSIDPTTNELTMMGTKYPQGNIYRILDYVTKKRPPKKSTKLPPFVGTFLNSYGYSNLPADLISNREMKQIVEMSMGSGRGRKILKWSKW